jgi:hypothetical protein
LLCLALLSFALRCLALRFCACFFVCFALLRLALLCFAPRGAFAPGSAAFACVGWLVWLASLAALLRCRCSSCVVATRPCGPSSPPSLFHCYLSIALRLPGCSRVAGLSFRCCLVVV